MLRHRTRIRVIYGDTDRMGYAYNANYLRWFEIGRSELFRAFGMTYKQIEQQGIFLPVSEVFCKFTTPLAYDDMLIIEAALDTLVKGGIKFDYLLLIDDNGKERQVARGYTKHACVDPNGRVVRPPAFLKDFIRSKSEQNLTVKDNPGE